MELLESTRAQYKKSASIVLTLFLVPHRNISDSYLQCNNDIAQQCSIHQRVDLHQELI